VGLGMGPTSVALLTDFWFADEGALRYSIAIVAAVATVAAVALMAWARPHFARSTAAAEAWSGPSPGG